MTHSSIEELESAALQLPQPQRAQLAERLLASLDEDDEVLAAWVEQAELRADALESGQSVAIPIDEAIAQARAGLRP
ncbi:addiction module protein [Ramlibacter sp. WS9]|uniref:addiction module protein n=1 Tax=Ramlibacter sp. WS9 TaxID=1882741 RepID=UPI0011419921|nr:addiction module protein [Ramlibacter sp. WS9]ROZ79556.1 addiction module protein [Ramlibacter sp. WS9]